MKAREDEMGFEEAMGILARRESGLPDGRLVRLLRHDAYFHLLNPDGFSGACSLGVAFDRYRTLLAAYAALSRPDALSDGPVHGDGFLNGVDVGPAVLRAISEGAVAWGRSVWERLGGVAAPASLRDGGNARDGVAPYADRFLAIRLEAACGPAAHRRRLAGDPLVRWSALAVADWWRDRLDEVARAPDGRLSLAEGQADAFRDALADLVTLTGTRIVENAYEPGIHLRVAMFDAGLPDHALSGWRRSETEIAGDGRVRARVGDAQAALVWEPRPERARRVA